MYLSRKNKLRIARWSLLLGLFGLIELLVRSGFVDRFTMIPISEMFAQLWQFFITGEIPAYFLTDSSVKTHFLITFGEIALSFALAAAVGLPLGILLWKFDVFAKVLNPYLVSYYAIPIFALYPLLVSLLGIGFKSIVAMGFLFAVVAIVINTTTGFKKIDEEIYPKVGWSLRLSPLQTFIWIYFPAAAPYIFTGLKLGFIYSLIGVIASEFIISTQGLGYIVAFTYNSFGFKNMYASILLILIIAILINSLLIRMENRIYRGQAR